MRAPVLVTPPAALPVSLADMKLHLRVDGTAEDASITSMIHAARSHLDGWTGVLGRALDAQTWRQDFDGFAGALYLPLHPVISISSVTYVDAEGATQAVDPAVYTILRNGLGAYAVPRDGQLWPQASGLVSVTYIAGDGAPDAVKAAIKLIVGDLYANREAQVSGLARNQTVDMLINPYRRVAF
jgi:uncharacterized phiE125 gp8 family phage protein